MPPALLAPGPLLLLQPRRVAARAIAQRIADERGWTIGREIGWQVRFERRFSADTRLLVATEGILTARLQQDPLLSDFQTIVLDEFHERSIHADLGARAGQAGLARARRSPHRRDVGDARCAARVAISRRLSGRRVPGRLYPLEIELRAGQPLPTRSRGNLDARARRAACSAFCPARARSRRR